MTVTARLRVALTRARHAATRRCLRPHLDPDAKVSEVVWRDSWLVHLGMWCVAAWCGVYALLIGFFGLRITNNQWTYLMSLMGGHLVWVVAWSLPAACIVAGIVTGRWRLVNLGLVACAVCCGAIAAYYVLAPEFDPGLVTVSWWIWTALGTVAVFLAWCADRDAPGPI